MNMSLQCLRSLHLIETFLGGVPLLQETVRTSEHKCHIALRDAERIPVHI